MSSNRDRSDDSSNRDRHSSSRRNDDFDDRDSYRDNRDSRDNRYSDSRGSRSESRRSDRGEGSDRSRRSRSDHQERKDRRDNDYRDGDYNKYRDDERYRPRESPSSVLILRGLNPNSTTETITDHLKVYGPIDEVRIIRNKSTGESRGIAFVDFMTVDEAMDFMDYCLKHTDGLIDIEGFKVTIDYSHQQPSKPRPPVRPPTEFKDWICNNCQGNNFARRIVCYLCRSPKPQHPETCTVVVTEEREFPCTILAVRGLDLMTTEETIQRVFSQLAAVKEIRLIREKQTQMSRGYCFVEFHSIEEATKALNRANSSGFKIDDHPVRVSYSRRNTSDLSSTNQWNVNEAIEQAHYNKQWLKEDSEHPNFKQRGTHPASTFVYESASGFYFDSVNGMYYDTVNMLYFSSTSQRYFYFDTESSSFLPYNGSVMNLFQQQHPTQLQSKDTQAIAPVGIQPQISQTHPEASVTTSAPPQSVPPPSAIEKKKKKKKDDGTKALGSIVSLKSKKISQEMEKWTKKIKELSDSNSLLHQILTPENGAAAAVVSSLPSTSTAANPSNKGPISFSFASSTSSSNPNPVIAAPSAFTVEPEPEEQSVGPQPIIRFGEPKKKVLSSVNSIPIATVQPAAPEAGVGRGRGRGRGVEIGGDSSIGTGSNGTGRGRGRGRGRGTGEEGSTSTETTSLWTATTLAGGYLPGADPLETTSGTICMLCQRQLNSIEKLKKHQELSELHKHNLENARLKQKQFSNDDSYPEQYKHNKKQATRNRPPQNQQSEEPQQENNSSENVGSKLLKQMGWKEGEGLGLHSTGITVPIDVEMRAERTGLGLKSSVRTEDVIQPGDTYQTAAKKRARSRFFSIQEERERAALDEDDASELKRARSSSSGGDSDEDVFPSSSFDS